MAKKVCVFGSYKSLDKKEEVVKLGKLLANKGFQVVTGGFGGTMEDVSCGAKESGGKTIGVTYYKKIDDPSKKANEFVDEEIKTNDIFERIKCMMEISDAFCVLPGGTGTLLELASCLEYINKGMMKPKPIIALGDFWKDVINNLSEEAILSQEARSNLKAANCSKLVIFAENAEKMVNQLERLL